MKVAIVSTFRSYGGASVCSRRLLTALNKHGVNTSLLFVLEGKKKFGKGSIIRSFLGRSIFWIKFAFERLLIYFSLKEKRNVYQFSLGGGSWNIQDHPAIVESDVVHLHWVSFNFLSVKQIANLARLKPLMWTLHDMWPFTGGCHYAYHCTNFTTNCRSCFYLSSLSPISASKVLDKKNDSWKNVNFSIIGSSRWITGLASRSKVFESKPCMTIGTPIDIEIFKPQVDRVKSTDMLNILFGAVEVGDKRKGFDYFKEAINHLAKTDSFTFKVTIFGSHETSALAELNCEVQVLGRIEETKELVNVFNNAHVFVLSSIQDNLPNIVMESMACGTPVVAFDSGGVSDMVIHEETGYLAENENAKDLANGITFFNELDRRNKASELARKHIVDQYSEQIIAAKHVERYQQVMTDFSK